MRSPMLVILAISASMFSSVAFGQCANGVCQMRTPVRSGIQAIAQAQPIRSTVAAVAQSRPVRSTLQAVRPANWRVFNSGSTASCSSSVASCSGAAASCSGYVQSAAPLCECPPAPSCSGGQAVAEVESVVETQAAGFRSDRVAFRRALKKATANQVAEGKITQAQAMVLNGLSFFPAKADAMMAAIHDAAVDEGLATTQAIDWDGLINFIERIMPIILQLIQLFGSVESMMDNVQGLVLLPSSKCFVALRDGSSLVLAV